MLGGWQLLAFVAPSDVVTRHFFYAFSKGPSINYVRNFTCYLDPPPLLFLFFFLHVIRNSNV